MLRLQHTASHGSNGHCTSCWQHSTSDHAQTMSPRARSPTTVEGLNTNRIHTQPVICHTAHKCTSPSQAYICWLGAVPRPNSIFCPIGQPSSISPPPSAVLTSNSSKACSILLDRLCVSARSGLTNSRCMRARNPCHQDGATGAWLLG